MSFAPDEPSEAIFAEKTYLQGTVLTGVSYGALFMLYCICMHLLWDRRHRKAPGNTFYMIYATFILIFNTLNLAGATSFAQLAFIDNRNYPGGPAQYENDFYFVTLNTMCNVAYMLGNWLADGLMLYRIWIIFRGSKQSMWLIMSLPSLLYAGAWAMGVLLLIQLSRSSPWGSASNVNWIIPFFSMSLTFNTVVTLVIVGRLYYFRRSMLAAFPGNTHGDHYTNMAAIVVESSVITAAATLLCLVPLVRGNAVANVFLQPLGEIQSVATLLIIYRIAIGRGWSSDTTATLLATTHDAEAAATTGTNIGGRERHGLFSRRGANATQSTHVGTSTNASLNRDRETKGEFEEDDVKG
ncbi:hypothetical protein PENSPDRAFT_378087 [Peniophora sp. CONT]|nr:hypothetical protein PENSPDRAFT_378087 [Peniophora sp. CONT]